MVAEIDPMVPLACVPGAIPAADRAAHSERLRRLFDEQAQERRDVADGYAWRFLPDAFGDVAAFVALERKCCPFLRFRIDASPASGPLWLTLDGPPGTRSVLYTELGLTGAGDTSDSS